jgi:hypothetical protein
MNYNTEKIRKDIEATMSKAFMERNNGCVTVTAVNTKSGIYAKEPNQVRVAFKAFTYGNCSIKHQVFSRIDAELDWDKVLEVKKEFVADVLHREGLEKRRADAKKVNQEAVEKVNKTLNKCPVFVSTYAEPTGVHFTFTVSAEVALKVAEALATITK